MCRERTQPGRNVVCLLMLPVISLVAGSCDGGRPQHGSDHTPPELAFVADPPDYVATPNATLVVTAEDPSGVAKVWCQFGNGSPILAEKRSGAWSCSSELQANVPNPVVVWAEDGVTPPNSGLGREAPYRLVRTIKVDMKIGEASADETLASFRNENGLKVKVDGAGRAIVPASYEYGPNGAISVSPENALYKTATRLAWVTQPSTEELESLDLNAAGNNIPTIRLRVPLRAETDAPITSATYSVVIGSDGPVTGPLWPSKRKTQDMVYFDLPLSSNLFPALARVSDSTAIAVEVTITNAVGTAKATSLGAFTFHVLGPPLAVSEDADYRGANDSKSTYPYRVSDRVYSALYDPGTSVFQPEDSVRLARFIVTNPAQNEAAVAIDLSNGSWSVSETWTQVEVPSGTISYYSHTRLPADTPSAYEGVACSWVASGLRTGCNYPSGTQECCTVPREATAASVFQFACAGGSAHKLLGRDWVCGEPEDASASGTQCSSGLGVTAYYERNGVHLGAAAVTKSGKYVVPGATESAPGVLAVYVVRPLGVTRLLSLAGLWNGGSFARDLGLVGTRMSVEYSNDWCAESSPTCLFVRSGHNVADHIWAYGQLAYQLRLTAATDVLGGALAFRSVGMSSGEETGKATDVARADLTKAIPHN